MKRFTTSLLINIIMITSVLAQPWKINWSNLNRTNHQLKVAENQRHLSYLDGSSFFWLGDTAWELFHKLDREDADYYLTNRAEKGFTVIQAVVLSQLEGLSRPNPYGALPLKNQNPAQPNEKYFEHVDYIVDKAESLGLIIGMLPTWGSYWKVNEGNDRLIFTPENARKFGQYLGNRYQNKPIVWILGGDAHVDNEEERAIIVAMAEGLRDGDQGKHLITFHPRGPGRSSDFFHQEGWLDFNMYQSSHAAHEFDNGVFADYDYKLQPVKPTIDGEPRYENIPVGFYYQGNNQLDRFVAYDARTAAYWSILAGAFGHTYGNNNIWQMYGPGEQSIIGANVPWYEAVNHAGAFNMMMLRKLFESRPFQKLKPAQQMIIDAPEHAPDKVRAALAEDKTFSFIYSPTGQPFTIDMSAFEARNLVEYWYDPRYGCSYLIHQGGNAAFKTYTPPTSGRGNDWILVIDRMEENFDAPGVVD